MPPPGVCSVRCPQRTGCARQVDRGALETAHATTAAAQEPEIFLRSCSSRLRAARVRAGSRSRSRVLRVSRERTSGESRRTRKAAFVDQQDTTPGTLGFFLDPWFVNA